MLPLTAPPLMREHRLYQADWLLRLYGYTAQEINSAAPGGMLDLTFDPKMAWALENRGDFPVDMNTAPREKLLRVPGLGVRTVERVLDIRKYRKIRIADLAKLCRSLKMILPFVVCTDWRPKALTDSLTLRDRLKPGAQQLTLL
jgi:predicted DNA-binding helix-hairpin-helix protein